MLIKFGTPLVEYDGSRENNFTLLRIFFAWAVLFGHSFFLQKTPGIIDPLSDLFQGSISIGRLAVNCFFSMSGFLVAGSFLRRGLKNYIYSRILRIFPPLFLCVFGSVFILGPVVTRLNLSEYFEHTQTFNYLINSLAFWGMKYNLPGVFDSNFRHAVNGSLWTLTVEVRCYFLLALIGIFGLLKNRIIANIVLIALVLSGIYIVPDLPFIGTRYYRWSVPVFYFFIGVFFYINRDKVFLDRKLAVLALIMVIFSFGQTWFDYIFPFAFVYLIFFTVYTTKFINVDRKIGDISYGIYIYSWPIQQAVAMYFPSLTPYGNILVSTGIVVVIAYISWHTVEKPILALKPGSAK